MYASATGTDEIVVIDEHTLQIIARIPAGGYPDGMAYDPLDQKLFVSDETGQTETVIDTRTNQRLTTIPLGGETGNTQYDPVAHRIYVAVQTRNQLVALDPVTQKIVASYDVPDCQNDHSPLLDVPQRLAFVACDENNRLIAFDLSSMEVLATSTVGQTPDVLALDNQWHRLYVSSESGVFDTGFGIAWFAGSATMGLLYDRSIPALIVFSVGVQLAALPVLLLANRHQTRV